MSQTVVSWVVVLVRKHYFRVHCEAVIRESRQRSRSLNLTRRLGLSRLFTSGLTNILSDRSDVQHLQAHHSTHDGAYARTECSIRRALAGGPFAPGPAFPPQSGQSINNSYHRHDLSRVASPESPTDAARKDGEHTAMVDIHSPAWSARSDLKELVPSPEVQFAEQAALKAKDHRSIRYRNG